MNTLKPKAIMTCVILAIILSPAQSSSAQSNDSSLTPPTTSFFWGQPISPILQKNPPVENPEPEWNFVNRNYSLENTKNASFYIKKSSVNNLSIGISRTKMFTHNDRASFTLYTPIPTVNRHSSSTKISASSPMDNVWLSLIQALSLTGSRKINSAFTYSVPVNKDSKFDSTISYRLSPITDSGKPGMTASLQISGQF